MLRGLDDYRRGTHGGLEWHSCGASDRRRRAIATTAHQQARSGKPRSEQNQGAGQRRRSLDSAARMHRRPTPVDLPMMLLEHRYVSAAAEWVRFEKSASTLSAATSAPLRQLGIDEIEALNVEVLPQIDQDEVEWARQSREMSRASPLKNST